VTKHDLRVIAGLAAQKRLRPPFKYCSKKANMYSFKMRLDLFASTDPAPVIRRKGEYSG